MRRTACYRWLPSGSMDRKGNIGIGYSFGGGPNFPGQRFAARLASDPPGQLTFHEAVLAGGEASQKNQMRWEDYTTTAMDPSDDCTFWYVGDYLKKGEGELLDAHRIVPASGLPGRHGRRVELLRHESRRRA